MKILRVLLAAFLATSSIPRPAFAQDDAGSDDLVNSANPLCRCVAREMEAADADFTNVGEYEAGETESASDASATVLARRVTLAQTQARLIGLARGLEFFRNVGQYDDPDMKRALAKVVPKEYLPHFSTRRRALYSTYRTLAVIDYTLALKTRGACADGEAARKKLLYAKDGLFIDPKTGKFTAWMVKLTGKPGGGAAPVNAGDEGAIQVGAETADAAAESADTSYQRMLGRQRALTRKIEGAAPNEKAGLLCKRARTHRLLAMGARLLKDPVKKGPTLTKAGDELAAGFETQVEASNDSVEAGDENYTAAAAAEAGEVSEVGWTIPAAKRGMSSRQLYDSLSPSVVAVKCRNNQGRGMMGTGSVILAGDVVLTNGHVVLDKAAGKPFDEIMVYFKPAKLSGDRDRDLVNGIPAKVIRLNRALDLALLKLSVPQKGLIPIELGDEASVGIGDPVLAIGHPEQGGLWTLTQGVVSSFKSGLGGVAGKDAFQTDASINRGNSGGPLLDMSGRQIGVNTAIARKAKDGLAITAVNFSLKSGVVKKWLAGPETIEVASDASEEITVADEDTNVTDEVGDGSILTSARPYSIDEYVGAGVNAGDEVVAQAGTSEASEPVADAGADASLDAAAAQESGKAKILTPVKPFNADDLIKSEMRTMDDLGKEMSSEIQRRAQGLPPGSRAVRLTQAAADSSEQAAADESDTNIAAIEGAADASEGTQDAAMAAPASPGAARMPPPAAQRSVPSNIPKPTASVTPAPATKPAEKWTTPATPKPADKYINTPQPKPLKPKEGCFGPNGIKPEMIIRNEQPKANKPKAPELVDHAVDQARIRNVPPKTIQEAIDKGQKKPGNKGDRTVHDLPSSGSSTGRGARVVTDNSTGKVITVIDKGSKFKPKSPENK